jgi:SAM-dependent methyltransferase
MTPASDPGPAPWFVEAFRADYLDVYAHRDEAAASREVRGALSLLRHDRERGHLLDLAAGAGRHSQAFQAERCNVTCLDLSADLVNACAERGLRTVRADMRAIPFRDWAFDSVACLFSSFGYFDDDAQHQQTLDEIARVLAPEGAVLLDLMDRDTVRMHLVPQSVDIIDEAVIEVERALVDDGRRVEKSIRLVRNDCQSRSWLESVRLFTAPEIEAMARRAKLEVETVVGDYDGRPHKPGETRRLVVLRKPRGDS